MTSANTNNSFSKNHNPPHKMKALTKLILLIFFMPIMGISQGFDSGEIYDTMGNKARAEMSKQAIYDLKNGVLVVRLKSGGNKLKALERVANSPSVSKKDKEKFDEKIAAQKQDTRKENERLMVALKEKYSFSEVLYFADSAVHLLKEGVQSGYFLNENFEIDPAISLNGKTYLIAYYGATNSATKMGEEGLVILDSNFKELVAPFPHYTGITTTRKTLGKFFNKRDEVEYFIMMAERFNERVEELYDKH